MCALLLRIYMLGCDRVIRVIGVPKRHQVVRGLADIFPIDDLPDIFAVGVEGRLDLRVQAAGDYEPAVLLEIGQEAAEPVQPHPAAGHGKEDDRIVQFSCFWLYILKNCSIFLACKNISNSLYRSPSAALLSTKVRSVAIALKMQ